MAVLNGRTWTGAEFRGSSGFGYAENKDATGNPRIYQIFEDYVAQVAIDSAAIASLQGLSPGAAGGYARSNGSAWVRVQGIAASDVTAGTFGAGSYAFPADLTIGAVGVTQPLDVIGTLMRSGDATANNADKFTRWGSRHYTNSEEPAAILVMQANTSANNLSIGGGSGILNAATQINFYTAANNTTTTGTVRGIVDSTGQLYWVNRLRVGASPGSSGGVEIDASSFSNIGFRALNGTGDGQLRVYSNSYTAVGDFNANQLRLVAGGAEKLRVDSVSSVTRLVSVETTFRVVGGSSNGFAVSNSAITRDNLTLSDAGTLLAIDDGTRSFRMENKSASDGDVPIGSVIYQNNSTYGMWMATTKNTSASRAIGAAYYDGQWRSAWEVSNVAVSNTGQFSLMSGGGSISIMGASATSRAFITETARYQIIANAAANVPTFEVQANGGSLASHVAVPNATVLARFRSTGSDGSGYQAGAYLDFVANGLWSGSNRGTTLSVKLIANGAITAPAEVLSVTSALATFFTTTTITGGEVRITQASGSSPVFRLTQTSISDWNIVNTATTGQLKFSESGVSTLELWSARGAIVGFSRTLTGTLADSEGALILNPTFTAGSAQTLTRLNYMKLVSPTLTNVTVTDAALFWTDAAAGTHKAIDSGTTKASPGTVTEWVKYNSNGSIRYIPAYSSKTS